MMDKKIKRKRRKRAGGSREDETTMKLRQGTLDDLWDFLENRGDSYDKLLRRLMDHEKERQQKGAPQTPS